MQNIQKCAKSDNSYSNVIQMYARENQFIIESDFKLKTYFRKPAQH